MRRYEHDYNALRLPAWRLQIAAASWLRGCVRENQHSEPRTISLVLLARRRRSTTATAYGVPAESEKSRLVRRRRTSQFSPIISYALTIGQS